MMHSEAKVTIIALWNAQKKAHLKYKARVEAGTIDSDYRGEIFVIMKNKD